VSSAKAEVPKITRAVVVNSLFITSFPFIVVLNTTFLLLGKSPTPCDYAARANPDGAKFSFAFSLIDLCAITR
jgi:hypothetical protein